MKNYGQLLLLLLALGILIACTQTPEQMAENALHASTVRLEMKDADGEYLGWGSGFFVKRDQIVTHLYVIAGASSIEAELVHKGKKFAIEGVTAFDIEDKLVILKVVAEGSKPLSLGNSDNIQGSGYILGYDKYSETSFDSPVLPSLPPETTGGPILNSQGKVVGVVGTNMWQSVKIPSVPINAKEVKELLENSELLGKSESLSTWQKRKPILPIATEQLAKKKGRGVTVRLISRNNEEQDSLGSGFFVEPNKIVTNIHVIANSKNIQAKLVGTETYYDIEGVTAFAPENDLAILKIVGRGPESLSLSDNDVLQMIGEPIAAVGNPQAEEGQIELGTIHSGRNRNKELRLKPSRTSNSTPTLTWNRNKELRLKSKASVLKIEDFKGYSGGPVLNSRCEVVGVSFFSDDRFRYAISSKILGALLNQQAEVPEPLLHWQKKKTIHACALLYKGQSKYNSGKDLYKEAIEDLDKAIRLYREHAAQKDVRTPLAVAYLIRGGVRYELKQYKEAIKDFDQTIKLIPDREDAYNRRGGAKLADADYEEAIADFDKVIGFLPDYANAYINRGATQYHWGKFEEGQGRSKKAQRLYQAAITDFDETLRLKPNDAEVYNYRGLTRYFWGKSEEEQGKSKIAKRLYQAAITDFDETLKLRPDHDRASNNLKLAERALKNIKQ